MGLGFTSSSLRFWVLGLWFRNLGSGFRVRGLGFGVRGSGFGVQGSGFQFQSLGFMMDDLAQCLRVRPALEDDSRTVVPFRVLGLHVSIWGSILRV